MSEIIFVGAGPVGLYTAIQLKLYCPELNITFYEKYEEYKRQHILRIDKDSYAEAHTDPAFQTMLTSLSGKVPTNRIESDLLAFGKKLGITVRYEHIKSAETLAVIHPEASIIIGSDGAHSLVRKQIFDDKKKTEDDLQYIAQIKYKVSGKTQKLPSLTAYPAALSFNQYFVSELVGKEKDAETPLSIQFFIDKSTFDKMKEAQISFKTPLSLHEATHHDIPEIKKLGRNIQRWLAVRYGELKDEMVQNSDSITMINLPVYQAETFAKASYDKQWYLVGDAAMGVPYFRALNAGLISANKLAKIIANSLHPKPEPQATGFFASFSMKKSLSPDDFLRPMEKYNRVMKQIAGKEIRNARLKDLVVKVGESSAAVSRTVPVSAMKVSSSTRRQVKTVQTTSSKSSCALM